MSKTWTVLFSIIGLIVGVALYYTGLLNPIIAWINVNVISHITNFLGFLKANPLASTVVGSLSGGGVLAIAKTIYNGRQETAVQNVTTQKQTEIGSLQTALFQSNKAETDAQITITALQQQIDALKAQANDNSALIEAQTLLTQKNAELERLRSDYNALLRLNAVSGEPQIVVK